MATKARKDSRGYALKKGESQRKDGRYVFRYTTIRGEQKAVYAKELSELRKKEVKIRRAIEDGLDPDRAERITLNELFDEYISQKYDLKQSTLTNYKYMYNHYVRVDFGKRRISKIKYTDESLHQLHRQQRGVSRMVSTVYSNARYWLSHWRSIGSAVAGH